MKEKEKADILIEALPYIQQFSGSTFVIKYGGSAMRDEGLKQSFALDIILMKHVGINPVIVHGGGPQINSFLERLKIKTRFVDGMRFTDPESMEIIEMVLVGKINKEIVNLINKNNGQAVGISGKDGRLVVAKKLEYPKEIGLVGEIVSVNKDILESLIKDGFIPVIAPVGSDEKGNTYNINADTFAGHIAKALKARKLILLTDVEGVLDGSGNLISTLTLDEAKMLIERGIAKGGMIPKIRCCIDAIEGGVQKAHIIDGRKEHALLLEIFTKKGIGTQIIP